jgi:hypothetical protein
MKASPVPKVNKVNEVTSCKHPAPRLYTWHIGRILCVCCCACGAVLKGGAR